MFEYSSFKEKFDELVDKFCVEDTIERGKKVLSNLNEKTEECLVKIEESGVVEKIYDAFEKVNDKCFIAFESIFKSEREK
ncbi:hypothetical protein KHQ82_03800 [Mycoplasmatota bacterium]|nr:hypothetical protein KHQ82_03800 [Mycoplasmatota bacterium]